MLSGGLFTRDFLIEGIRETPAWIGLDEADVVRMRERLGTLFADFGKFKNPTEAETEKELIWPILAAIGWADISVQQNLSAKRREDVPDALLFPDAAAKALAVSLDPWQRFQHGVAIVEAKRWNRVLDRHDPKERAAEGVPSTQMLRYLRRVDDVTGGHLRWGMLTNGRHWRLYFKGALSVAEDFFEIDLGRALALPGCEPDLLERRPDVFADDGAWSTHGLKLFLLLFGRAAFLPDYRGETFHQAALREGKRWEAQVARDLSDTVFDQVFPMLAEALATADGKTGAAFDPAYCEALREAALVFLYRLLFVLYAEDRNLLPDESGPYAEYSLTRLRLDIADKKAKRFRFSDHMKTYWSRLDGVFQAIAQGDDSLGIPPYNGGLFDPAAAPLLARVQLPDSVVAEILFRMSHIDPGDGRPPKYINYRDLSVQQLGSVYERILEHGLEAEDGHIRVAVNPAARKGSGSYYTPEELVALIIGRAVGPLVDERISAFTAKAAALAHDTRSKEARIAELSVLDPASRLLDLKICDPAMGSGHFLVSLVDWLADRVLDAMAEAMAAVGFADYVSPLASRIAAIREKILAAAQAHGWPVAQSQLDDRHIVRRMVLKRVVHGVDKNPMAVELAKLALWLHSFTVGAPLSFLDHHLRHGDSILGAWTRPIVEAVKARGALFNTGAIAGVERIAGLMAEIEETTDNDIAEVTASKEKFGAVAEVTAPIAQFFSLLTAETLMGVFAAAPQRAPLAAVKMANKSEAQMRRWRAETDAFEAASAFQLALEGAFGDPIKIAAGEVQIAPPELAQQLALLPADEADPQASLFPAIGLDDRRRVLADRLVGEARARAGRHFFFHWEIGFPNLWSNLLSAAPRGGFDAVIGNPPYVRQELLGDEVKRALKARYRAFDGMADLYVYFFEQGLRLLRPGGRVGYVVTNKWLKAGYAEGLRDLFARRAYVEFVADFGHAKHFFPDADVFPSVVVLRQPALGDAPPAETEVCVIPRDAVPEKGLSAAVANAGYRLPRAGFTKEGWTLEPPAVVALLDKIRRNGMPLEEFAGSKPYRGVLTGLNDAFVIDGTIRERLIQEDARSEEIIKPFLRGQDIDRWASDWAGQWMIFARHGIDIDAYPAIKAHLAKFRRRLEPKPHGWQPTHAEPTWPGRKPGSYHWHEIQDKVAYWALFGGAKIIYNDITWNSQFCIDRTGSLTNNTAYFIPIDDPWLLACLNAPVGWWFAWRKAEHAKDKALRYFNTFVETYPIPERPRNSEIVASTVRDLTKAQKDAHCARDILVQWYRHSLDIETIPAVLRDPFRLGADAFGAAIRKARGAKRALSAATIRHIQEEHERTVMPMARRLAEAVHHERLLSDLVNAAYGLTPEEVALMWRTAPPCMPLAPADELHRLGIAP